jgi:hypothetical protein
MEYTPEQWARMRENAVKAAFEMQRKARRGPAGTPEKGGGLPSFYRTAYNVERYEQPAPEALTEGPCDPSAHDPAERCAASNQQAQAVPFFGTADSSAQPKAAPQGPVNPAYGPAMPMRNLNRQAYPPQAGPSNNRPQNLPGAAYPNMRLQRPLPPPITVPPWQFELLFPSEPADMPPEPACTSPEPAKKPAEPEGRGDDARLLLSLIILLRQEGADPILIAMLIFILL